MENDDIKMEQRTLKEECNQLLEHACLCHETNCQQPECSKMKLAVQHKKNCNITSCLLCRKFVAVCNHHSELCEAVKCPVPYCAFLKFKLNQQLIQR